MTLMENSVPLGFLIAVGAGSLSAMAATAFLAAFPQGKSSWPGLSGEPGPGGKTRAGSVSGRLFAAGFLIAAGTGLFSVWVFSCLQAGLRAWALLSLFLLYWFSYLAGSRFPLFFSRRFSFLIDAFRYLLYPFAWAAGRCGSAAGKKEDPGTGMEEMVESPLEQADTVQAEAPAMIRGVVGFSKVEVCEIMRPRVDVVALSLSDSFEQVMEVIHQREYSRMPVYESDLDHIVGFLYIKDLIMRKENASDFRWQDLLRPALFVPETEKINALLREFQKKRLHIAVVVDDYGGTSGIVTLEDIIEEVVGEINDESDALDEDRFYQKIDAGTYLFDGRMPIHDLCKLLGVEDTYFDVEERDYESLAGLVLEEVGYFPAKGMRVAFKDFVFTVEAIGQHRITRIRMNRIENAENEPS